MPGIYRRWLVGLVIILVLVIVTLQDMTRNSRAQSDPTVTPNINWVSEPEGILVRSGPGYKYDPIGQLPLGSWVQPLARNRDGEWILISYLTTQGWVLRELVSWRLDTAALPRVVLTDPTPIPRPQFYNTPGGPTYTPNADWINVGVVGAYVRSGPAQSYKAVGQLFTGDVIDPVARDRAGNWIMFRYKNGYAWIRYDLVKWVTDTDALPIIEEPNLTPSFTPVSVQRTRQPTPTATPTVTSTFTPTDSATPEPSDTPSPTATESPTPTATDTPTPTDTITPSPVPPTNMPEPSDTPSPTATESPTPTATDSPTPTDTVTPSPVPPTNTPEPSDTPSPTATELPTPTATDTPLPTDTLVPTDTPTPTEDASATAVALALNTTATAESRTDTPVPTDTSLPTDTVTPSPVPPTDTPEPSNTPSPTATESPTPTITDSPTPTDTVTPSPIPPKNTPKPSDTVTPSPVPPTATPTPPVVASAPDSGGGAEPGSQIESGSDESPSLPAVLGGGVVLVALIYAAIYGFQAASLSRYREGFPLTVCPVCHEGHLTLEERRYRILGIPNVRRVVRCDHCRSVLRQVGQHRWRYTVDHAANAELFDTFNGRVLTEERLLELAPEYQPPEYIEGDDTL